MCSGVASTVFVYFYEVFNCFQPYFLLFYIIYLFFIQFSTVYCLFKWLLFIISYFQYQYRHIYIFFYDSIDIYCVFKWHFGHTLCILITVWSTFRLTMTVWKTCCHFQQLNVVLDSFLETLTLTSPISDGCMALILISHWSLGIVLACFLMLSSHFFIYFSYRFSTVSSFSHGSMVNWPILMKADHCLAEYP